MRVERAVVRGEDRTLVFLLIPYEPRNTFVRQPEKIVRLSLEPAPRRVGTRARDGVRRPSAPANYRYATFFVSRAPRRARGEFLSLFLGQACRSSPRLLISSRRRELSNTREPTSGELAQSGRSAQLFRTSPFIARLECLSPAERWRRTQMSRWRIEIGQIVSQASSR